MLPSEGMHLNPRDPLLTAAVTPELRIPPHVVLRTGQVRAHWALGLGEDRPGGGSRVTGKAKLVKREDEWFSPRAKGKSGQTNGVEPVYLGWTR